jgi:hypothetical protein
LAVLLCAAIETYALADRSRGEPRNADLRRYVLGEIFDTHRVEQRFIVKANGLSSVTIHPRPASPSPTGSVVVQLRDITDDREQGVVVQRTSTPLVKMAQSESFTMRFPPQSSVYREYALDVMVDGASDGQGIGLLASRGEGYRGGALLIDDGRPSWGDLIFETTVDDATSNFGSIASQLAQSGIPAARVVLLLVLVAKYLALLAIIRAFAGSGDEAAFPVPSRPSLPA